ncbi:MAG: ABC transporter ATP-binding protein [Actinobacteria bacterium]|nr:ABC transporter ATP-binding protein [Actinomycetota bacterium]
MTAASAGSPERPVPAPVDLNRVTLRFAGLTALDDVSLAVPAGSLFAVIGPNGAGKTSIFNCISGVYRPTSGRVLVGGRDVAELRPDEIAGLGVARTFQNVALFPFLTVLENVLTGRHHLMRTRWLAGGLWLGPARREEVDHRAAVERILDFLDLARYRAARVGMLPYGVQKRLELARALAMEPSVLLLDEPSAGMNQEETEDMARYILDIREEMGITQILVEHDMGVVMDLADEVAVLDFGRLIARGRPEEIQGDPEVIRAYLGGSRDARVAAATEEGTS